MTTVTDLKSEELETLQARLKAMRDEVDAILKAHPSTKPWSSCISCLERAGNSLSLKACHLEKISPTFCGRGSHQLCKTKRVTMGTQI